MYLRAVCGTSDHREDRPTEGAHVDKIQEAMVLLMSLVQVWAVDDDDGLCPAANSTTVRRLGDILTPHVSPSSGFPPLPASSPLSQALPYLLCMADSFSLVVNDTSPTLNFFPFSDTLSIPDLFAGWNPCFTSSACSTFPGQQGNGTSSHVTSLDGAAFSVQWWGV